MTEEKDQQSETQILYDTAGGPAPSTNPGFNSMQSGGEQFVMKIPNDKVLYLIGRYGQTIKNIQTKSGALIEIGPMHLPCDDTSTEKSVYINGETTQQIEAAKELVNEVILGIPSETNNYLQLLPFPPGTNSYMQQKGLSYDSYPLSLAHTGGRAPSTTVELFMMQARAKHQKIGPLPHLPHGDASSTEQSETTNEVLKEIIKGKGVVNASGPNSYKPPGTNSYMQQQQQQQVSYPPSGTWVQQQQPPQYGYFQPGVYGTPPLLASSHGNYLPPVGDWNQLYEMVKSLGKIVEEHEVKIKNLTEAQARCQKSKSPTFN